MPVSHDICLRIGSMAAVKQGFLLVIESSVEKGANVYLDQLEIVQRLAGFVRVIARREQ